MTQAPFVWDAAAVAVGLDEIEHSRYELLQVLKDLLDSFHGIERNSEYYDLVAGDWLIRYSHNVYTAWREVVSGVEPPRVSPVPKIRDSHHAADLVVDIDWHRHLRWAVARRLQGEGSDDWVVAEGADNAAGHRRLPFAKKLLRGIATSRPKALLTSPCFKCSKQDWLSVLVRWRRWAAQDDLLAHIEVPQIWNWSWRKKQASQFSRCCGDFSSVAASLMPLYLPVTLLEGFEHYRAATLALDVPRPEVVVSGGALHGNLTFKLLMAEWRQEGTRLLYQQHGGGYGLEPRLAFEEYETRLADRFYSWGWTRDGVRVTPLSPAMPVLTRNRRSTQTLLNCLDLPQVPYRLMFTPMPGTIEDMHRNTYEFLMELTDRKDLTIRPYPVDYGSCVIDAMRAVAPEATFDSRSTNFSLYAAARLVVHNYLGTSWLETLGLNIPTVCFFNPSVYVYREDSKSEMAALRDVGVLHHSGKDAAKFVTSLGSDVEGWWNKTEVQAARKGFIEKYANFTTDWAKQWEREFLAAINGVG